MCSNLCSMRYHVYGKNVQLISRISCLVCPAMPSWVLYRFVHIPSRQRMLPIVRRLRTENNSTRRSKVHFSQFSWESYPFCARRCSWLLSARFLWICARRCGFLMICERESGPAVVLCSRMIWEPLSSSFKALFEQVVGSCTFCFLLLSVVRNEKFAVFRTISFESGTALVRSTADMSALVVRVLPVLDSLVSVHVSWTYLVCLCEKLIVHLLTFQVLVARVWNYWLVLNLILSIHCFLYLTLYRLQVHIWIWSMELQNNLLRARRGTLNRRKISFGT